jgi:hypothetical protein
MKSYRRIDIKMITNDPSFGRYHAYDNNAVPVWLKRYLLDCHGYVLIIEQP